MRYYQDLDLSIFAYFRIGIFTVKLHGAEERQHDMYSGVSFYSVSPTYLAVSTISPSFCYLKIVCSEYFVFPFINKTDLTMLFACWVQNSAGAIFQ